MSYYIKCESSGLRSASKQRAHITIYILEIQLVDHLESTMVPDHRLWTNHGTPLISLFRTENREKIIKEGKTWRDKKHFKHVYIPSCPPDSFKRLFQTTLRAGQHAFLQHTFMFAKFPSRWAKSKSHFDKLVHVFTFSTQLLALYCPNYPLQTITIYQAKYKTDNWHVHCSLSSWETFQKLKSKGTISCLFYKFNRPILLYWNIKPCTLTNYNASL